MSHQQDRFFNELNDTNLCEFSLAISGPDGQVYDDHDVKWTYTGGPVFNRVFGTRLDKANADTCIDEIVEKYK